MALVFPNYSNTRRNASSGFLIKLFIAWCIDNGLTGCILNTSTTGCDMNYQCWECEAVFSEDEAVSQSSMDCSELWGSVAWSTSTYLCCPKCGSEEINEHKEAHDDEN